MKRNHAFDFLCGVCIIRMMMLHITEVCQLAQEDWWQGVMYWSFFFMSFFFFKAGYFNKTVSGDSRAYCWDKFKRLMVPYFVWGAIGSVVYFAFAWFVLDPKNTMVKALAWDHLWTTSKFYGNVPCWFLLSFFCAYIAMHFMVKVRGLRWLALTFPLISWWLYTQGNPLWLSLNNVFFGIFLFFLGRVWRWVLQRLSRPTALLLSLVLSLLFVYVNMERHGEYEMSDNLWHGDVWWILLSTVTSLCGLSGVLLSVNLPRVPVVNYIGQHSMVFFVAHYPMLVFYKMVRSANGHSLKAHWDDYILLTAILFGVCFLLVPYVERVPWLSGRWKKKVETEVPVKETLKTE